MLSAEESKELQRAVRRHFRARVVSARLITFRLLCDKYKVKTHGVEILPRADYDRALEVLFAEQRDAERIMFRLAFS